MAKVTAHEGFNGKVAGVQFVNGKAESDNPGKLAYFARRDGYTVESPKPVVVKPRGGAKDEPKPNDNE